MPNENHFEILMQGVEAWNKWRNENSDIRPILTRANLSYINLTNVDFSVTDLSYTDLALADLVGASLRGADLSDVNLSYVKLYGADLMYANLSRTILEQADFTKSLIGHTIFAEIDLSLAIGLDTVTHYGPSTLGVDTIYRSGGDIPDVFLKSVGIPSDFIVYAHSLIGKAIEFYSCFISYSARDQEFANRLYIDLQSKGVRCWFAPEDLKIGDKFRQRIDESIRLHDKLLLILSEMSIASHWVEDEVEAALERERKENRPVLFPISIDSAVWDSEKAWAASLRRTRHIGDFKDWKSYNVYQKTFERLLRDLKTDVS